MAKPAEEPKLTPGVAFHLQPDGSWAAENLPHKALDSKFSGYLTINGYRCSVFEASDQSMWAQKSVDTPATTASSKKEHEEPDMSRKCPTCGGKATDVRGFSACCAKGHFFEVTPKEASAFVKIPETMDSVASRVAARWVRAALQLPSPEELQGAFAPAVKYCEENRGSYHGVWGSDEYGMSIMMAIHDDGQGIEILFVPDINSRDAEMIYSSDDDESFMSGKSNDWKPAALEAIQGAIKKAEKMAMSTDEADSTDQGQASVASRVASAWLRLSSVSVTPDQLKQSLIAQLFAYDEQAMDFVSCDNPAIHEAVAKAEQALKAHNISKVMDLTGDQSLPKSADEKNVKLLVDLQYSVDGKAVAIEGSKEGGIDTFWRDIYKNVAQAVGPMYSEGEQEKDPGLPSDPQETLWWNGKTFSSEEPSMASTFGKAPKSMDTVASRVYAAWLAAQHHCSSCRNYAFHGQEPVRLAGSMHHPACPTVVAARADDLVAQVNDILEGKKSGPFGEDDQRYDEEILEYCESVRKAIPEMQEILDNAFHEAMDFKMKLPQAESPKVRQLAQEKISEMLNQAAARLEIISHGLMMEIEGLCAGLAQGAGEVLEEEPETPLPEAVGPELEEAQEEAQEDAEGQPEVEEQQEQEGQAQQASSPLGISKELMAIAAALENSKNPDPQLVALDLREVMSRLAGEDDGGGAAAPLSDIAFIHMNTDLDEYPDLDPDGSLCSAFSHVIDSLGGNIENWEDDWLEIEVPRAKLQEMIKHLQDIEAGTHGAKAQKIAQAYGVTEVYGDDGEGSPGDIIPSDQY
jgi:hypothetical protein